VSPAANRVLVTGGSGFLGRHVCAALLRSGARVRILTRGGEIPPPDVEVARAAGLDDLPALRAAVEGCGAVVHLAARVHVMDDASADPLDAFRRVNVEGTRNVVRAAADAGCRTLVHASSVKAVGEASDAPWTEAVEPRPADPYGVSKLESERVVCDEAARGGMAAAVLRLPLVYGPGVRANMLRLFQLVDRGVPLPLGAVANRRSLLYAGNAAAAVLALLERSTGCETYFVSDGPALSTPALVREIAAALGRPARLLSVPPALFRAAGRVGDLVPGVPVTTAAVSRLVGSLEVDDARLRAAGYQPPFTVQDGLRETAQWYRARR
jgi:nucleoside-diphosphate-sugar epimerase